MMFGSRKYTLTAKVGTHKRIFVSSKPALISIVAYTNKLPKNVAYRVEIQDSKGVTLYSFRLFGSEEASITRPLLVPNAVVEITRETGIIESELDVTIVIA